MKSMNRVQLFGWLGNDIKVKTAKDGSFRMSTDNSCKTATREYVKKTNWHTVWIWDNKIIERYQHDLITGSHVLVEGAINYRDYTDSQVKFNHVAKIRATNLIDLDR